MAEEDTEKLQRIADNNFERTVEREDLSQEIATLNEALIEVRRHDILRPSAASRTSGAQSL
ncbi:hypothetical protein ONS96_012776 [Cadophora gregata f. sp. sojae]|nr:hypothetical protein ONS96_012776 [Cadophora gregata f. sp. sojae]